MFFNHKSWITIIPTNDKLINPIIMGKIFFTAVIYIPKDNMFLQRCKTLQIYYSPIRVRIVAIAKPPF